MYPRREEAEALMFANIDPVAFTIGPFAVRWYGLFMAVSILIGFFYFRRDALRLGHDEDFIYNLTFLMVIAGVIGARLVYVATNWDYYGSNLGAIYRIDQGGLSFHGAIGGGALAGWLYATAKGQKFIRFFDLAIPGVAVGIMLVRIGNLINGEVMGRTTELLPFDRHPAQIYASILGVVLLIIHNVLARQRRPDGYLTWSFSLYYSLFRAVIEETVRENPLYVWGYVNDAWGIGFFTLTHLISVPIILLAVWQRREVIRRGTLRGGLRR